MFMYIIFFSKCFFKNNNNKYNAEDCKKNNPIINFFIYLFISFSFQK